MRVSDAMLPRLASEFSQGISAVSAVVSLFAIAYGFMQFAYGPLGDRLGKLRVIAVATMAGLIGNLICALAPVFPLLLAGRVLSGATAAAVIPLSMAWIGDQVHYSQRQTVLARFLTGQMMGFIAGQFAGGWFSDTLGWRGAFFTLAAIFLTVGVVLWQRARNEPRPAANPNGERRRPFSGVANVVGRPWARVVLATVLIEGFVFFGAYAFVPLYLHERFTLSLTNAGLIAATLGLGGLAFSFSVRFLVQRLGETGLALGGGSLLAAGLALIALAPSAPWVVPGCLACGLGFYMLHNTLQLNATQMAPEHRGTAVSLFASMLFLGQAGGVTVAGLLVPLMGVRSLLGCGVLAVFLVGLVFFLRLRNKQKVAA
ncbi:MFS transporter [Pigmentiphaga aceris]|uniref:MFS transporter n=2 Tax=Pigmentiphaga aceris TaxID=1940612 RepID=A0A5C0B4D4_9BURK|nr:MFS transporter [Pigmentiphaga aceris]